MTLMNEPAVRSWRPAALLCIAMMVSIGRASAQEAEQQRIDAAVAAVSRLQNALVEASSLSSVTGRFEALHPEITATHNLEYIGQLTVRRHWRDFTAEQRSEFLNRFKSLSVMTYAARFADVTDASFQLHGAEEIGDGRIQVQTSIGRADGSRVPIDYTLQQDDEQPNGTGTWRIVNVIADGVSDLALKRAEYRALLDAHGFDGLLEDLEAQTAAMAE